MSNSTLTVDISHLKPQGEEAREVFQAMLNAKAEFEKPEYIETYVAQGRLLPHQASVLRTTAYQRLYATCGCTSISSPSLHNLFDTWVEKAIVDIEREVELVTIERQIRATMLEVLSLADDLESARAKGRLVGLAPAWALRNLDGTRLRSHLDVLTGVLEERIAPIITLHYPEALNFTQSQMALINALTTIDPGHNDIVALVTTAKNAAGAIKERLEFVKGEAPTPLMQDVIVSIPNPDKVVTSGWRKVDAGTARRIWDDIKAGRNPVLTLKPEFIYSPAAGGQNVLPCHLTSPIVHSMALFFAHNELSNYRPLDVTVSVQREMEFPTNSFLYKYSFLNDDYLGPYTRVMFGPSEFGSETDKPALEAMQSYWNGSGTQVGAGISPFSTFTLNLQPLRDHSSNPLSVTTELLVGFRLETKQEDTSTKLPTVLGCEAQML